MQLKNKPDFYSLGGRRGRDRMVIPMQSVAITTNVVSANPANDEMYSIQHYVIKFVSNMRQVGGFLWFPPSKKPTATI